MALSSCLARRAATITFVFSVVCSAQKDPGVRGGPSGAGGPISGLQVNERALFDEGRERVVQLESVCDTCNDVTLGSKTRGRSEPGDPDQLVGFGLSIQW